MKKFITSMFLCGVCTILSAQTPPITPAWGFRHIVWEDSINTSESAKRIVDLYLERDIPVGSIIGDSPWSNTYNDFDWDEERYPNANSMIKYSQFGCMTATMINGGENGAFSNHLP